MAVSKAHIRIYNNTVFNNIASGFWFKDSGKMDIRNNIVFANGSNNWVSGANHFGPESSSTSNNLTTNPFLSTAAIDQDYLKLRENNASVIDRGSNELGLNIEKDFAGNPRVHGAGIDIGAFEYRNPNSRARSNCIARR